MTNGVKVDRAAALARAGKGVCLPVVAALAVFAPLASPAQDRGRDLADYLDMNLEELASIEVTSASKRAESIVDAPATVRVITDEQIRERGYLTLEQALAELPGMQFRDTLGLNSYVFVRGVPNQNNLALVLIDGVELNELNSGGFYGGGQYNLTNVKRIEVVYGPTSALYGTNAVSGVINIITKETEDTQGLQATGAVGSFKTGRADLQYSFDDPETRFGLRVAGMVKTTTHADLTGSNNDYMWTPDLELFERDQSLDVKVRFKDFLFGANYQSRVASSATYHRSVGTTYLDHDTLWNIRFLNTYLRHRTSLTGNVSLQSEVYARETTVANDSVREITDAGQFGFYRPNYLTGAEVKIDARVNGDLDLIGGLVLEYDWLAKGFGTSQSTSPDQRPPRPPRPAMTSNSLVSSYLQAQYRPAAIAKLTAGVRFDRSSTYHEVLTPRAGIVVSWRDLVAKLLYGEAYRAPKPWDYTDGLGNKRLDPERMRSVELSVGYLWRGMLRAETALYWNRLYDVLEKEIVAGGGSPDDWRWANGGRVDTLGLEAGLEARMGPVRAFVNYTFTHSRDEAGDPTPEIAEHGANAGIGYHFTGRIRASVWGNYLGSRPNPKIIAATGGSRIDPAFLLNASLSFLDLNGFDFQFHVRNALDKVYYHPSNLDPDRYRQPQRTVMVEAAYRF